MRPLATVVVCEDDDATRELLCDHLMADRYRPLAARSAADALRQCRYKQPDLMILDLGLPDAGGLDVLREIRSPAEEIPRFDPDLPIIVLTGRGGDQDRVRGLSEGADDYLVKPFHYAELLARLRAILRRRRAMRAGPRRVGEVVIDPVTRRVTVAGEPVRLSAKEFSLLGVLARDPTRVFTKQELLREIWGLSSLSHSRTLDSHASRLRMKLCGGDGRYVINCWGVGYRLIDA
jgi:DNA-binding response OmpR family regulator